MSDADFQNFHDLLHSGGAEAVDRLLADMDSFLRRVIRRQLFDRNACRIVNSADFVQQRGTDQAVVSARKLKGYLVAAARNKIAAQRGLI